MYVFMCFCVHVVCVDQRSVLDVATFFFLLLLFKTDSLNLELASLAKLLTELPSQPFNQVSLKNKNVCLLGVELGQGE